MNFRKIAVIAVALIMLVGCGSKEQASTPRTNADDLYDYAINEGEDVIARPSKVTNSEKLDAFISGALDEVRVVRFITEDSPIFYNLLRKEDQIEVRYDTSQDKYGSSSVKSYLCDSLQKEEKGRVFAYKLNGCGMADKSLDLLDVPI